MTKKLAMTAILLAGFVHAQLPIHNDCKAHDHPVLCTVMVNDLIEELVLVNRTFEAVNPLAHAELFHPEAVW